MRRSVRSASTRCSSRAIELVKILVAGEHVGELARHRRRARPRAASTGPAPPVPCAHRRSRRNAGRALGAVGPEHVAGVAVAVQAQRASRRPRARSSGARPPAPAPTTLVQACEQIGGNEAVGEQPVARLACRSSRGRAPAARRTAASAPTAWMRPMKRPIHSRVSRSSSSGVRPPRRGYTAKRKPPNACRVLPPSASGATTGSSRSASSQHEGVLFEDLRVAPACRAVELRRPPTAPQRRAAGAAVLQPDLIDAVLVAVQAEQAPVAAQAYAVERIEHAIGRESGVGRCGGHRAIVRVPSRRPRCPQENKVRPEADSG